MIIHARKWKQDGQVEGHRKMRFQVYVSYSWKFAYLPEHPSMIVPNLIVPYQRFKSRKIRLLEVIGFYFSLEYTSASSAIYPECPLDDVPDSADWPSDNVPNWNRIIRSNIHGIFTINIVAIPSMILRCEPNYTLKYTWHIYPWFCSYTHDDVPTRADLYSDTHGIFTFNFVMRLGRIRSR